MELKTTERAGFTVRAPPEGGPPGADRPDDLVPAVRKGPKSPGGSGEILSRYKAAARCLTASGLKVSAVSKAGVGIVKMIAGHRRRRQERRTWVLPPTSAGSRRAPSDHSLCRSPPLDPPAALAACGQSGPNRPGCERQQDECCPDKLWNRRRIVVLGAPRTGKTSILRRFLRGDFTDRYEPTSEDFHRKLYRIRGEDYQVDILDAAGERSFPAKRRLSILTGDVFLLVCSADDRGSLEEVRALREEIVAAKTKLLKRKASIHVPVVVCVNKADLDPSERDIGQAKVRQVLGGDCAVFETSAKDGTNLEEMFGALAKSGGLPKETLPSMHRQISIHSYRALGSRKGGAGGSRARERDASLGALCPLARRPSVGSDLRRVLGSGPTGKPDKSTGRRQIRGKRTFLWT